MESSQTLLIAVSVLSQSVHCGYYQHECGLLIMSCFYEIGSYPGSKINMHQIRIKNAIHLQMCMNVWKTQKCLTITDARKNAK